MKKLIFFLLSALTILVCKGQVQVVNLDGSASNDPDGTITSWQWLAVSTNPSATVFGTPTAAKTTVVPAGGVQWVSGTYKFVLKVTDNLGAFAQDTMNVTFKVNIVPKANAGPDQTITYNSTAIGGIDKPSDVAIHWRKLYGRTAMIQEPTKAITKVTGLQTGLYVFEKTVTNSAGRSVDWCYVHVRSSFKAF